MFSAEVIRLSADKWMMLRDSFLDDDFEHGIVDEPITIAVRHARDVDGAVFLPATYAPRHDPS